MDWEELVRLISMYLSDDGETVDRRYGPEARDLVGDMVELLEEQLTAETPFAALWSDYSLDPQANEAEMIGALEVMEEANPTLKERLEAFYDAFDFEKDASLPIAETGAGAATVEDNTLYVGDIEDPQEITQGLAAEGEVTDDEQADYADDRERYNREEISEANFRYPVWPDYIDESNTYLVGDREDDQSTSPTMYFDEEGSDNADYSALPADETDDYEEADEGTDDEPGDVAS